METLHSTISVHRTLWVIKVPKPTFLYGLDGFYVRVYAKLGFGRLKYHTTFWSTLPYFFCTANIVMLYHSKQPESQPREWERERESYPPRLLGACAVLV